MRTAPVVGIILVIIGVLSLAYQGISFTTREKKVDLGPIEVVHKDQKAIPLPPIIGVLALAGGIALLVARPKRLA